MKIIATKTMPIDDLLPADYNPRKISAEARKGLRRSIERFGLVQPIVWNERTGIVVGGHQRLGILKEMGYTEVPIAVVDLDPAEERALNVTLNNKHIQGEFTPEFRDVLADVANLDASLYADLRFDALDKTGRKEAGFDPDGAETKIGDVSYRVVIECDDDRHQAKILLEMRDRGLNAKGMMV